jgi:uncharacterized membrane protein YgcG
MIPRIRWYIAFAFAAILLGAVVAASPVAQAQEKSLVWERFDVDIAVNEDGTFDVAEHQRIRFTDGTFTFGFREIPKRYLSQIDNWAISDSSGNQYRFVTGGNEPYTFTISESSYSYTIRWYFPPTANTTETYTLSYVVHGGLRYYDGGDQLWWKAIYGDRSFPVLEGRVTVTTPAPISEWAAYINATDARDSATATLLEDGRTITFDLDRRLKAGEEFEVRVQFPHGVVAGSAQPWQQAADAEAARREAERRYRETWGPIATVGLGALGALFLFGGPALLYLLWYSLGRDKPVEMVADYLPEPPDDLPPGLVGTLLDEQADMRDIIATIVDLARRRAISITEVKKGKLRTSTDFIYRRERDDVPLRPYEVLLLTRMFKSKDEVKLSKLKNKFYEDIPDIKKAMYEELTNEGLFVSNPESTRNRYGCLGAILMILAGIVGFIIMALFSDLTAAAILPGFGLGVTAVGFLILARFMPKKTDKGAEIAARWQAFKNYLKDIDKYSDLEQQKEIWDRWLPYAIAFGYDKSYIRKFEKVDAPAPGWYIPSPDMYGPYRRRYYEGPAGGRLSSPVPVGAGGMGRAGEGRGIGGSLSEASRGMGTSLSAMSAGLGTMLSSASRTMTSRPSSSSSGGGWSGGGGGFSGGGSFGGGGGGGGGGGFG